jgi:hypothetical protein
VTTAAPHYAVSCPAHAKSCFRTKILIKGSLEQHSSINVNEPLDGCEKLQIAARLTTRLLAETESAQGHDTECVLGVERGSALLARNSPQPPYYAATAGIRRAARGI